MKNKNSELCFSLRCVFYFFCLLFIDLFIFFSKPLNLGQGEIFLKWRYGRQRTIDTNTTRKYMVLISFITNFHCLVFYPLDSRLVLSRLYWRFRENASFHPL